MLDKTLFQQYMGKQFERAGDKWDRLAQAVLAKAQGLGRPGVRHLRLVQVALKNAQYSSSEGAADDS